MGSVLGSSVITAMVAAGGGGHGGGGHGGAGGPGRPSGPGGDGVGMLVGPVSGGAAATWMWWLLAALAVLAIAALAYAGYLWLKGRREAAAVPAETGAPDAVDAGGSEVRGARAILEERLARGDIEPADFRERVSALDEA